MFVYWNADKMHKKELCNVIYIVATVFRVNDFPCANNVRSIGDRSAIPGKQGMFVIIYHK